MFTSIRLSQLSNNLDKELDPIRDEIEGIKSAITALESGQQDAPPVLPTPTKPDLPAKDIAAAREKMLQALSSGQYLWRSIERLAIIGGVSVEQALPILRADPSVVLSIGKSNRQIARLATRTE